MTERASRAGWQAFDRGDESELPPWAGPVAPIPSPRPAAGSAGPAPRVGTAEPPVVAEPLPPPGRSRAAAGRRRRSRRRILTAAGAVVLAGLIAAGWYFLYGQPSVQSGPPLVQSLQPGEFARAPRACHVLTAAALSSYLGGTPQTVLTFAYPDRSQCSFTVDAQPVFRVLSLTLQAYQPYLGAPGNGSATDAARFAFAQDRALLSHPPKRAPLPPALITPVGSLGSQAISALQVTRRGIVTDFVTVLVRYRNVLVTASLQAQESGGFGPVAASVLQASAVSAARQALSAVKQMPA